MEKKEARKTAFTLPKVVSVIAVIVIIVSIFYIVTRGAPLSKADPADVVTKLSDLPSDWSETMSTYKTASNYEINFPTYTGHLPEIGYYVSFSKGSASFVSEAIRFSSVDDANSFYDYLYGRLTAGAEVHPDTIGDKSIVFSVGENIGGLFRKSNFIVNNASAGGEFTLSEFTNYLQICEGRI